MKYEIISDELFARPEFPPPAAGLDAHFLTTFFCPSCYSVAPCEHPPGPERQEGLVRLREAMIRELERAGYCVTPPVPVRLRGVPPIDLKTDHEAGK